MSKSTNIVKLSNGENLICTVVCDTDKHIEIESPLKMETISRVTKTGVVESLSLGKWVQPFSDQKTISLNKNLVIINLPVTIGLEKYSLYMVELIQKQGRIFVQSQKRKDQRSLLLVMVLLAQVSIFAIFTTSCSQVRLNQEYECYNQSDEDCVLHQLKIPL